eukprot:4377364-Pyramimonas_sp.AAC.1
MPARWGSKRLQLSARPSTPPHIPVNAKHVFHSSASLVSAPVASIGLAGPALSADSGAQGVRTYRRTLHEDPNDGLGPDTLRTQICREHVAGFVQLPICVHLVPIGKRQQIWGPFHLGLEEHVEALGVLLPCVRATTESKRFVRCLCI